MPIPLKLADSDTPEPWQAALPTPETLEYAREGLPTARPRSLWRTGLAIIKRLIKAGGWMVGAFLVALAFSLLIVATLVRLVLGAGAGAILLIRRLSPFRFYAWMRYGGRVPEAQVA